MASIEDILTLAEAANLLGVAPSTLRHQAKAGRLHARLIGKTWVTTRDEVERYRHANRGRPGRIAPIDPRYVKTWVVLDPLPGRDGPCWLMGYEDELCVVDPGGGNPAPYQAPRFPPNQPIENRERAIPPQVGFDPLTREQVEKWLGMSLDTARRVYVDFPEPAVVFRAGPVWSAERFERWLAQAQKRTAPRISQPVP